MNTPDTEWSEIVHRAIQEEVADEVWYGGSANERQTRKLLNKLEERLIQEISSRDTYWKERVRKEVEGMKGIYDENGLQTQWIQKAEILQALDNMS